MENVCRLDTGLQIQGPSFLSFTIPPTATCLPLPSSLSNIFVSSSTVILDSLPLLTSQLEPIYESEPDSPPLAKCSKCTHHKIMAPSTDHYDEDDGFICICSSALHSLLIPHDSLMAAFVPIASGYINICGSVCLCNENHFNCSKCVHQHEEFKNHWILNSGASMHFTPHRDAFTSYHKFSKDAPAYRDSHFYHFVEGKETI